MSRPKNMVRRWPVRRVNETQAHGDAPQVPISPHPRSRRVVTRHQSQIRAHSLRCLVTLEAENDRWGRGRDTRSAVRRRGTPFSASVMNWKCYYLVEFSELALPAEEAGKVRGHLLSKGYTYVYDTRVLMHFENIKDLDVAGFKIFEFNYWNKSTINTT